MVRELEKLSVLSSPVASAQSSADTAEPFLRWAGSKRWLVPVIREILRGHKFADYYEPFLGSGAVYFGIDNYRRAFLSDVTEPLIQTYESIRDNARAVHEVGASWPVNQEMYYDIRASDMKSEEAAARFLYLNRFGYNGLYRENQQGQFNVPFGRPKNAHFVSLSTLTAAASKLAASAKVHVSDFEEALATCRNGDLVYLDPPYVLQDQDGKFRDYNSKAFSWSDQVRLSRVTLALQQRGVSVMVSNVDDPSILELYEGMKVISMERFSSIAASVSGRTARREVLLVSPNIIRVS